MSEAEQRHSAKIQSSGAATYRQAVAIASYPPHLTTLSRAPFPDERLPQPESVRQCGPAADVADDRRNEKKHGQGIAREDEPERTMVLV